MWIVQVQVNPLKKSKPITAQKPSNGFVRVKWVLLERVNDSELTLKYKGKKSKVFKLDS